MNRIFVSSYSSMKNIQKINLPLKGFQILSSRRFSTNIEPVFIENLSDDMQGISVIHLADRKKKNAMSSNLLSTLSKCISTLKNDLKIRTVIVKSDVPGTFCAGADLIERAKLKDPEVLPFVDNIRSIVTSLSDIPVPVIAAINGWALGGGLELALGADIRVSTTAARMGLVETKWGLLPGAGGSQRLARIIGIALAKEMIFTARIIDGSQALQIGLVNHAVDGEEQMAYQKALDIAKEILKNGPLAVRAAKTSISCGYEVDLSTALRIEQQCYGRIVPTKDRQEGMRSFREKTPPVYKGE